MIICVPFQLLVISIIQYLEFFFDRVTIDTDETCNSADGGTFDPKVRQGDRRNMESCASVKIFYEMT